MSAASACALAIAMLCAACVTTKLTGLFAGPLVLLTLAARALLPEPWTVFRRTLVTRAHRLLVAFSVCVACALVTYVAIWAVYLFRFNPSPDPAVHYDTAQFISLTADRGPSLRAATFSLDHHLLPEPFLEGCVPALPPGVLSAAGAGTHAPVGRIHFAGAERSEVWEGHMDGAVRSAERVAAEILGAEH